MNGDNRREILQKVELFRQLSLDEFEELLGLMGEQTYERGDPVCLAGEIGDEAYVIMEGELEIYVGASEEKLVARLGPGEICGEICLLMGDKRTATMKAAQLTTLLVINKDSFNRFLTNNKALGYLVKKLSLRLEATSKGDVIEQQSIPVAVAGEADLAGKELVAAALAKLLQTMSGKEVLLIEVEPVDAPEEARSPLLWQLKDLPAERVEGLLRPGVYGLKTLSLPVLRDREANDFGNFLSTLVNLFHDHFDFSYLVFRLGSDPRRGPQRAAPPALAASVGKFANYLVRIVSGEEYQRLVAAGPAEEHAGLREFHVLIEGNQGTRRIAVNACEPFFVPADPALKEVLGTVLPEHYRPRPVAAAELPEGPAPAKPFSPGLVPLERLARKIRGKTVGLALGGGAAFGISHLGVLKFLEQHNIPIDLVAGCSIGSMVASGYAAGVSVDSLIEMAHKLGQPERLVNVLDFNFSKPGLISGDGIKDIFEPYLKDRRNFDRLIWPLRVCATDIRNGLRVDIGAGRLADAFRASSSVPVVITPYEMDVDDQSDDVQETKRHVLVDGGVVEPVPVDVVRRMGADIVIAINVVPQLKEGVELPWASSVRTLTTLLTNPLNYFSRHEELPNGFDTSMLSLQTLQHELGKVKMNEADISIEPDLSDFTWIEFYRSTELIETGYRALYDESVEMPGKSVWQAIYEMID